VLLCIFAKGENSSSEHASRPHKTLRDSLEIWGTLSEDFIDRAESSHLIFINSLEKILKGLQLLEKSLERLFVFGIEYRGILAPL
jgi:hypothetical protein